MTQTVKRAWIFLAFIKLLVSNNLIHYLCTKTMDKKTIVEMMENESLLERFMEVLIEEINNDDEAGYRNTEYSFLGSHIPTISEIIMKIRLLYI